MHIVFAANARADQPWAADTTADIAKQTGASVAVVSVDEVETSHLEPAPRSMYVELADQAASAAVDRLKAAGVSATKTVLSGPALNCIKEFAQEQKADLIVVGSSTRTPVTERLIGSVPLSLIKESPVPVVVVTNPDRNQG